jgi:hypothetical protein
MSLWFRKNGFANLYGTEDLIIDFLILGMCLTDRNFNIQSCSVCNRPREGKK